MKKGTVVVATKDWGFAHTADGLSRVSISKGERYVVAKTWWDNGEEWLGIRPEDGGRGVVAPSIFFQATV